MSSEKNSDKIDGEEGAAATRSSESESPDRFTFLELPTVVAVGICDMLDLRELVRLADNTSKVLRDKFSSEIAGAVRALDDRRHTLASLRWVVKRGIKIRNFTLLVDDQLEDRPLHWACEEGEIDIVAACLEFNDIKAVDSQDEDENGRTPLMCASGEGHTETVKMLLGAGAAVDSQDVGGLTPLMYASAEGYTEVEKLLLDAGAH